MRSVYLVFLAAFATLGTASAQTPVPEGNRHVEQPGVPGGSAIRTRALRTTYEAKYAKIHRLLKTDRALMAAIKGAAAQYEIDPIHIVGAIVGEHTYNVDAYDRLQTYYVKAASYLASNIEFRFRGETVDDFVQRAAFEVCEKLSESHEIWICRERVWNDEFRGRTVEDVAYPDDRFGATFFQPFYAGQTFGIGQLNPLTALQMSDEVHRVSGLPKLDHRDPRQVYRTIMDPGLTMPYVAATLKRAIEAYRDIAGFDISGNPGITATLYNVGNPEERAAALKAENRRRLAEGTEPRLPEENYYGWLVNDRLEELRDLL